MFPSCLRSGTPIYLGSVQGLCIPMATLKKNNLTKQNVFRDKEFGDAQPHKGRTEMGFVYVADVRFGVCRTAMSPNTLRPVQAGRHCREST